MNTNGIMEDIRNLLKEGRSSAEVIALGYAPSSVYKAQRQLRKPTDRTDQPVTQVLVTNMASEGWSELREENSKLRQQVLLLEEMMAERDTLREDLELAERPFLVYEYVPGGDLYNLLLGFVGEEGQGLPPELALELMRDIVEPLAYTHERGLVHRDLKPANILVKSNSRNLSEIVGRYATGAHFLVLTVPPNQGPFQHNNRPNYCPSQSGDI